MQHFLAFLVAALTFAAVPAAHAQLCTPIESICTGRTFYWRYKAHHHTLSSMMLTSRVFKAGVTVTTGANAGQGICQININVQINILIAPTTPAPAVLIDVLGPLVTAFVPLPFIGIFPIIWIATPLPGCPGTQVCCHSAAYGVTTALA